jgi:hypothetical protein
MARNVATMGASDAPVTSLGTASTTVAYPRFLESSVNHSSLRQG